MQNHYELLNWDWAKVSDVYRFQQEEIHGAGWGIKGHNRPWVISQGQWKPGMRFLDVGAGYSDVPAHLVEKYDMEGWVADDFGMSKGESLWSRWGDPQKLIEKYPKVKYVFKCIGTADAWSELPKAHFDRIYSISTLEHIPGDEMKDVFSHMMALLKPGGIMLHSIDIPYDIPFVKFISMDLTHHPFLKGIISLSWQFAGHWRATRMLVGNNHYPGSPGGWAHFLKKNLIISSGKNKMRSTPIYSFALDPDVLVESIETVYKVIPPNREPKPFRRTGSLIFILRSLNG